MKTRMPHMQVAVYLVLMREEAVLMLLRRNTGYMDGKYGLIAGHVEKGESITASLCREAYEEAGIGIQAEDLVFIHAMQRTSENHGVYVDFFFKTESWTGAIENREPDKCHDLKWFPLDRLPKNSVPYIRRVLQDYISGSIAFSEYG